MAATALLVYVGRAKGAFVLFAYKNSRFDSFFFFILSWRIKITQYRRQHQPKLQQRHASLFSLTALYLGAVTAAARSDKVYKKHHVQSHPDAF
jgi:hypothetical protein